MNGTKGNWLLLIVSVLLSLLIMEVVLRLSGAAEMKARFQCFDSIIGKVYCNSAVGLFSRGPYSNYLVVNSTGMVDREYPFAKSEGTLRIALLGDSFTASEYLPTEEKFEGILEHDLTKYLGKPVDILNFGISATETWNQLQVFHINAVKYQPDVIFLAFFWGNDVRDNIGQLRANSPNPLLDEYDAPLTRQWKEIRKNFNNSLWNNLLLYQIARVGYGNLEQRIEDWFKPEYINQINRVITGDDKDGLMKKAQSSNHNMVDTLFDDDDLFFWESEGWEITRKLIIKLKLEAEAIGGRLVLLHFPSEGLVISNISMPHEKFNDFLKQNEIPYVSLFNDYYAFEHKELRKHFISGDGHWTPYGHEYVAKRTRNLLIDVFQE